MHTITGSHPQHHQPITIKLNIKHHIHHAHVRHGSVMMHLVYLLTTTHHTSQRIIGQLCHSILCLVTCPSHITTHVHVHVKCLFTCHDISHKTKIPHFAVITHE